MPDHIAHLPGEIRELAAGQPSPIGSTGRQRGDLANIEQIPIHLSRYLGLLLGGAGDAHTKADFDTVLASLREKFPTWMISA